MVILTVLAVTRSSAESNRLHPDAFRDEFRGCTIVAAVVFAGLEVAGRWSRRRRHAP